MNRQKVILFIETDNKELFGRFVDCEINCYCEKDIQTDEMKGVVDSKSFLFSFTQLIPKKFYLSQKYTKINLFLIPSKWQRIVYIWTKWIVCL